MILLLLAAAQQTPPAPPVRPADGYRPAIATMTVEPVAMMLAGFDADGDARITRAEAAKGVERSFGEAKDVGYIGFGDWAERWLGDRNAVPSPFEVDRNGDNRITLAELQDRIDGVFTRFDTDKDGVLIHKELLTIRATAVGQDPFGDRRRRRRDRDDDRDEAPPR